MNNLLFPVRKKKNTPFIISFTFTPIPICCVERRPRCFRVKFGLCPNSTLQCKQYSPSVFGGRPFSSQWEQLSRVYSRLMVKTWGGQRKGNWQRGTDIPFRQWGGPSWLQEPQQRGGEWKTLLPLYWHRNSPKHLCTVLKTQGRFFFPHLFVITILFSPFINLRLRPLEGPSADCRRAERALRGH